MAGSVFRDDLAPTGLVIHKVDYDAGQLRITGRSRSQTSICPGCDCPSTRVHSRYHRTLARLFVDETTAKMLAPSSGKTKTGYLWAMVRDNRPHGGVDPPAIVYRYMPGRGGMWAAKLLGDYHGILQVDGYEAHGQFGKAGHPGGPSVLAYCWAHVRRGFFDAGGKGDGAPIATEALRRIGLLYDIEREIHGHTPEERLAVRQARSRPIVDELHGWLDAKRRRMFSGSPTLKAINYALSHWAGLIRFLDDGWIDIDKKCRFFEQPLVHIRIGFEICGFRSLFLVLQQDLVDLRQVEAGKLDRRSQVDEFGELQLQGPEVPFGLLRQAIESEPQQADLLLIEMIDDDARQAVEAKTTRRLENEATVDDLVITGNENGRRDSKSLDARHHLEHMGLVIPVKPRPGLPQRIERQVDDPQFRSKIIARRRRPACRHGLRDTHLPFASPPTAHTTIHRNSDVSRAWPNIRLGLSCFWAASL